tara:strand:+ start:400 stop:1287 length:888 start_codon:yes stop_codon:yes gene_type:complete
MNFIFSIIGSYKFRSIAMYTLMFVGFLLILITSVFLIYRDQATSGLSELNYDETIVINNVEYDTYTDRVDNDIDIVPDNLTENQQTNNISSTNSPSKFSMFPAINEQTWSLSLDKEELVVPNDNIDLQYYDKWTSFYLDKKFLVDGISKLNKIYIPSISVDSNLSGLEVQDIGDSNEYETPNKVVGYIPSTIEPNKKNIWFFGHLESPLYGEGSIFKKLPEIPDLLRTGKDVFVYFDDEYFMYKYKVISSKVVHEDELTLYDTDSYSLTLVTCVPKWVYDHRLVITAELHSYAVK